METLKEKILVIQTAFPGDAVLTLPMLQELKRINPASSIDVIAIPSTAEIFLNSPSVNEVIILDKKGKHRSIFGLNRFCKDIRQRSYSRIYSPHRSFRTSFVVLQTGVKETYGFTNSSLKHVYKYLIEYNEDDHEVKRNLALIGVDTSDDKWRILPVLNIPVPEREKVKYFIAENRLDHFIGIAPGSVWNTKIYPAEYYKEIIARLTARGFKIVLIGSDKDIELCDYIAGENPGNIIRAAGKFSLVETAELLRYADLLVCNDSAPAHLGQSADIPVLTLYCSTNASIGFYPYSNKGAFLSYDDLSCKPCGIHGRTECPIKTFECGFNLKPASVLLKIEEMINGKAN